MVAAPAPRTVHKPPAEACSKFDSKNQTVQQANNEIISGVAIPESQGITSERPLLGEETLVGNHPWLVSIQYFKAHVCAGSIVSDNIVLTTARCTNFTTQDLSVRIASLVGLRGPRHSVVYTKRHKGYQVLDGVAVNDVGLIKVSPEFVFMSYVRAIALPGEQGKVVAPGTVVTVAGWISTFETRRGTSLMSASLRVVDNAQCKASLNSTQFCVATYGGDVCQGDPGSPVVVNGVQVGIVPSAFGCVYTNRPKSYISVSQYRDWIITNVSIIASFD